jgi:FlaA1/EpsC-like NDP-sugar epimerase
METLLIIGGTGTLGYSLVQRFINMYKIVIMSRDENKQWQMRKKYPNILYLIGDIRDKNRFENILFRVKPNKIIIAAALKHIDICEHNIDECISTNIIGIQNVINTIADNAIKNLIPELNKVIFISTDKATSPVNVYGMCKAICEKIVTEKFLFLKQPQFVSVRYGNVLNSRGSLLPLFHEIGKDNTKDYFPITNTEMTRFFMHIDESIDLIIKSIEYGQSGDIFIPKVKSYRILDIANQFSKKYGKPIKVVGNRSGEKIHECLINYTEKFRTIQKDTYSIIKPYYQSNVDFTGEYTSDLGISTDITEIEKLIESTFNI